MKPRKNPLPHRIPVTALAALFPALSSSVHGQSWDGGHASSNSWGQGTNWVGDVAPTFGTSADLTFNNLTRPNHDIGAARVVRSITYGADMDGAFLTNFRTFNGGAAATLTLQAASGNASIAVNADATGNLTLGWNGAGTPGGAFILGSNLDVTHHGTGLLLVNRAVTGTGTGFTKLGTGTMSIAAFGDNTFSGAVTVSAGRLIMGNTNTASASGDFLNASGIDLDGGTLEMRTTVAVNKIVTNNITVSSASTLAYNNTTATNQQLLLNTGSMALNADLTVQNISATTTLANVINISRDLTGSGQLIVDTYNNINSGSSDFAAGRVSLGGANGSWSGNLVIRQGTAQVFGDSSLGQVNIGTGDLVLGETANASGAGFLLGASTVGAKTITNDIIVRSGGFRTIRGGSDNTYTLSGNISLEGDLNIHNGLYFTDKNMIFTGDISGVGGLSITESGNPNFTRLSGNNTYSGATSIGANAVLNINSSAGNAIGDSSAVNFAGAGSVLVFNTTHESVGSIASEGTNGAINLGANTLTTGGNDSTTSFGGTIIGSGGLTKEGSGIMTLTGNHSYTGATNVNEGTLVINGSISTSALTTVASGATISGDGSTGALSVGSGGFINPGNSPGILDVNGNYNQAGLYTAEINGLSPGSLHDQINVTGTVNITGGSLATIFTGSYSLGNMIFILLNDGGDSITGTYAGLPQDAIFSSGGFDWQISYVAHSEGGPSFSGGNDIALMVVPEPQSAMLASLSLLVLLRRRRA